MGRSREASWGMPCGNFVKSGVPDLRRHGAFSCSTCQRSWHRVHAHPWPCSRWRSPQRHFHFISYYTCIWTNMNEYEWIRILGLRCSVCLHSCAHWWHWIPESMTMSDASRLPGSLGFAQGVHPTHNKIGESNQPKHRNLISYWINGQRPSVKDVTFCDMLVCEVTSYGNNSWKKEKESNCFNSSNLDFDSCTKKRYSIAGMFCWSDQTRFQRNTLTLFVGSSVKYRGGWWFADFYSVSGGLGQGVVRSVVWGCRAGFAGSVVWCVYGWFLLGGGLAPRVKEC